MNHPMARLFAPISVIILFAASTVLVSTSDTSDFTSEMVVASATTVASDSQVVTADQPDLD